MEAKDIKNITILGAGMISPGIAQIFASAGYNTCIYARRPEALVQALDNIRANLTAMAEKGLGAKADIEPIVSGIKTTSDFNEAALHGQLIIECLAENLELKQGFFKQLDEICPPETILCTNTSVISITEVAAKAENRARIVGTHFWNPAYLIPLVEVIQAEDTSDETMEITYQVMKNAVRHPIKCKDAPGFVANRLQHALWREAISIVERGIADAATVDEALKAGFAVRLPVLAPIENADMAGLDLTLSIHSYILKYLESSPDPSPLLKEKVEKGELGFKTGLGFQKWSPEEIDASKKRLRDYLIEFTIWQQSREQK